MRALLKSNKCCDNIEIIFPCSKKELEQLNEFLLNGKIHCENENDASKVFENLHKILGFSSNLDSPGKFVFDLQQNAGIIVNKSLLKKILCFG